MDEGSPEPTISIVLHKVGALPASVMREIRALLQRHFEVQYTGSNQIQVSGGSWQIGISYRLFPLAKFGPTGSEADRRVEAHCELLDQLAVSNGVKAIAIALHEHWSADLRERFGEAAKPATVKRWRLQRRRAANPEAVPSAQRLTDEDRIVRGLRRHHAIRTNGSGSSIRDGYRRALVDIRRVNSGAHHCYGKPDSELVPFSYETFRRECRSLRERRPVRPRR
jgi:hypothetical protein